jgi:hypothetical protein
LWYVIILEAASDYPAEGRTLVGYSLANSIAMIGKIEE